MHGDEALPYPLNVRIFLEMQKIVEKSKRFWCDLVSWPERNAATAYHYQVVWVIVVSAFHQ